MAFSHLINSQGSQAGPTLVAAVFAADSRAVDAVHAVTLSRGELVDLDLILAAWPRLLDEKFQLELLGILSLRELESVIRKELFKLRVVNKF